MSINCVNELCGLSWVIPRLVNSVSECCLSASRIRGIDLYMIILACMTCIVLNDAY